MEYGAIALLKMQILFMVTSHVNSELFVRNFPFATGNTYVVHTNGSLIKRPVEETWKVCKIGDGIVFLEVNNYCYDESSFSLNRGTLNQLSNSTNRDDYVASQYTVLDMAILNGFSDFEKKCALRALTTGKRAKQTDFTTKGNRAIVDNNGIFVITLDPGASVELVGLEGKCCSCQTGGCGYKIVAGNTAESVICATGVGQRLFVYNNNNDCGDVPAKCLKGNPLGVDAYLPTSTSTRTGVPMGLTYNSFLTSGLETIPWSDADAERSSQLGRKKRFVEFIALAIATAAEIQVNLLWTAVHEGFKVTDANDRKIFDELLVHEQEIFENLQSIVRISLKDQERDLTIEALNSQSEKYYELLDSILLQLNSVESFLLYLASFVTRGSLQNAEKERKILEEFPLKYPNETILNKLSGSSVLTIYSYKGNILTGNCPSSFCDGLNCQLQGSYYHYMKENIQNVEYSPYLSIGTCGIFYRSEDQDLLYSMLYASTFEDALRLLRGSQTDYCYVLPSNCYTNVDFSNYLLEEAKKTAEYVGFKVDLRDAQTYYTECETMNRSMELTLARKGLYCNATLSADDLRNSVKNFRRINWTLESAESAFLENGGNVGKAFKDFFESVGEGLGSFVNGLATALFATPLISILVVILLIWVILLTLATGLLFKKVFFSSTERVLREREHIGFT